MSMSRRGFAVVAVAVAVAMAVTMFAVAGCGSDDASAVPTVTLVQGATDLSVDVAVGDEFVVEVASNPTTGYSWAYRGVGSGADVAEVSSTFTGADTEAVAPAAPRCAVPCRVGGGGPTGVLGDAAGGGIRTHRRGGGRTRHHRGRRRGVVPRGAG